MHDHSALDPDLGPELICRQFALSRSRLYRPMREGGNIAATIRGSRLARAHEEIAAGRHAGLTAAEVAARFGFRQERSFRRAFVQASRHLAGGAPGAGEDGPVAPCTVDRRSRYRNACLWIRYPKTRLLYSPT